MLSGYLELWVLWLWFTLPKAFLRSIKVITQLRFFVQTFFFICNKVFLMFYTAGNVFSESFLYINLYITVVSSKRVESISYKRSADLWKYWLQCYWTKVFKIIWTIFFVSKYSNTRAPYFWESFYDLSCLYSFYQVQS